MMMKLVTSAVAACVLFSGCGDRSQEATEQDDSVSATIEAAEREANQAMQDAERQGRTEIDAAQRQGQAALAEAGAAIDSAVEAGENMATDSMNEIAGQLEEEGEDLEEELKQQLDQ